MPTDGSKGARHHLAMYNFGLHVADYESPAVEGFRLRAWPALVLWWVEAGSCPQWADGVARLEHLHDNGASAHAFTFKESYDPAGTPSTIDRARVRRVVETNAVGQAHLLAHVRSLSV